MYYRNYEEVIMEEKPYNWRKHALYQLPELFGFLLKVFFGYMLFYFLISSVIISSTVVAIGLLRDKGLITEQTSQQFDAGWVGDFTSKALGH